MIWKIVWQFLEKLNTELLRDSSIPFLGTYPRKWKTGTQMDTGTSMPIVTLFTIVKK